MQNEIAVFGGGCFWCTEAVFKMLKGVTAVQSGYAGGETKDGKAPEYEDVAYGKTNFVEVIKIEFDPSQISFNDLLTVFFASHDPTTPNRQGADIGPQYRSVIFYTAEAQKIAAEKFLAELNASSPEGKTIVTELLPLTKFYPAEDYNQNFYENNSQNAYCQIVINPKLDKVKEKFVTLLRAQRLQ